MRDNPMNLQNPAEIKLLELYQKHDSVALELLNLLRLMENAIVAESSDKLEIYGILEKDLVSNLTAAVRVLDKYKLIDKDLTFRLHGCSLKSSELRKSIRQLHLHNVDLLKLSIDKTSKILDSFSMTTNYKFPVINEPAPQFIDLSV